ncbi:MAG: hypothetical protein ACTHLO_09990 [Pseudolabrys sp.]
MAEKLDQRDRINLGLAGIMAIGLLVAIVAGLYAIFRYGQPDGTTATVLATTGAWVFVAAFLVSFVLALRDSLKHRTHEA